MSSRGLAEIVLIVDDVRKAAAFYEHVVGQSAEGADGSAHRQLVAGRQAEHVDLVGVDPADADVFGDGEDRCAGLVARTVFRDREGGQNTVAHEFQHLAALLFHGRRHRLQVLIEPADQIHARGVGQGRGPHHRGKHMIILERTAIMRMTD